MTTYAEKSVCITGVGQSKVGRPSPKSALNLTLDACDMALADAGLSVGDIDGLTTYPGPMPGGGGFSPTGSMELMYAMGLTPAWIGASTDGHAHMSAIISAVQAIASGMCRHVLVFRTVAQASARAVASEAGLLGGGRSRISGGQSWNVPFNAISPAHLWALFAQAYFDKYGATSEQLGAVAVNSRKMAAGNPNAIYTKPLSIDEYLSSRVITTPLRLYDCDTHIDGSTALVLSRRDIAADLRNPPIHIEAMGMAIGALGQGLVTGDFTELPAKVAGDMLWSRTDLKPKDLDCAQVYDGFSILTLLWMEALGLCKPGEAAAFVEGGQRIGLDGELPLNTSGGQLSAGRFHGYGHTHEACVQLWGRGGERQVKDAKVSAVCNGGFGYGALLLRRD